MTLGSALSSALSGLAANTRAVDVLSGNLANALTEGFAPREITLAATRDSRGVQVTGVVRQVDQGLLSDRRLADSARAASEVQAGFARAVENAVGTPDAPNSLTGRLAAFEVALETAANRPEDTNRLAAVLSAAQGLTTGINDAAADIARLRTAADRDIATAVQALNAGLKDVAALNAQITKGQSRGHDITALEDQRQRAIDALSLIVPLRQLPRGDTSVALVTTGGGMLLDGRAVSLTFEPAPLVTPHMTYEGGHLSGIAIDGTEVTIAADRGPLQGGRLGALFDIRDRAAVEANAKLDALARDLVERFQEPGLDATRAPNAPGFLTDAGTAFAAENEPGIANRIAVTRLVDPAQGGALFRIRDGLGAPLAGPPGSGALLGALSRALTQSSSLPSGLLGGGTRSVADHAATLISSLSLERVATEERQSFATGQAAEFRAQELATGVDSDAELQRLLLVEQAFGANARMIQTIDDMLDTLLRI
ncbi:flagellar hook-associated protein FlgK [Roseovarius mucosus DSM 17069]|uniref:Flagellar hook-associated protein 1 n=1 Tax=Roseovarius mucosus DSM 17069 TaxID=1288298 RepID=A0A0A0HQ31_9RHOB|nr:flagellar hook-associated protein FlgK [Roseovarius mucosus]KGM89947.1 flagellar hook-associated protein FlgK [Roseovarius mucosus DSM 17069]